MTNNIDNVPVVQINGQTMRIYQVDIDRDLRDIVGKYKEHIGYVSRWEDDKIILHLFGNQVPTGRLEIRMPQQGRFPKPQCG